jgi:hypothetical protein
VWVIFPVPSSEHYDNNDLFIIFNSTSEKKDGGKTKLFSSRWMNILKCLKETQLNETEETQDIFVKKNAAWKGWRGSRYIKTLRKAAKFIFEALRTLKGAQYYQFYKKKKEWFISKLEKIRETWRKALLCAVFVIQKHTEILIHKATRTRRHGREYYGFFSMATHT